MTIGDRFTALLDARGVKQSALAAQYRERMAKRGREFAQDTIESHISRLKKSEAVAVRFFFSDLTDARDLLDLLGVPEQEQDAYVCDANALLSPEERPLRVVVDLSDFVQGRALIEVGDALADKIVLAIPERVGLVVTESQRGYLLPRCTPEGRVQVQVVANAEQGWAWTQKLAADGAIVVSGRRYEPLSRWIAIEQAGQRFRLEPSDGITRCAKGLPIDDMDESALHRRLDGLFGDVAASAPPQQLVATPCALRSLLTKLTLGRPVTWQADDYSRRQVKGDAASRAGWAKTLNVVALASEDEWGEMLLARAKGVGVAVSANGSANDLVSHRIFVARGGSTPRAILVGGELHLINATDALRTRMQGLQGVQFHEVVLRESGFQRIEKLVATTPWEAWLDDPYMEAAIARIDPDGTDRDELEFARASLLLHGKLNAPGAPCTSAWRTTLTEMLKSDPPPVGIRVPTTIQDSYGTKTLLPASEVARREAQSGVELLGVPALAPPRVLRETSLLELTQSEGDLEYAELSSRQKWCMARRFLLPRSSEMKNLDSLFLLFDSSPFRVGYSEKNDRWWSQNGAKHLLALEWKQALVPTLAAFWREADETLAALWIALRRAVKHADATTLHDGTGMLEMGGGLVALIRATHVRTSGDERVEADFWRWPQLNANYPVEAHPTVSIKQEIDTRVAQTNSYRTCMRAEVPKQLFLAQGTARVTITFKATPWETLGERAMRSEFGAVVAGVLHAEDDAEAAASYDDD
jgi:hypothetical protein